MFQIRSFKSKSCIYVCFLLARFSVNRAVRPASVSIRPNNIDGGNVAAGALGGTWVTVTAAATVVQQPPVPTLYKATANSAANTVAKNTTNLILAGNKSAPVLTPAPSSISIIGPPKATVAAPASNITLFSVRGSSSQPSKPFKTLSGT